MAICTPIRETHPSQLAPRRTHGGIIVRFDTTAFPFAALVRQMLEVSDLTRLHEFGDYERLRVGSDQRTEWHRRFYDAYEARLQPLFRRFVPELIQPLFGERVVYQRVPTFRVHLPGNVGVGEFHADGAYNHPEGELNFLLPLTSAQETSTVWVESDIGVRDYRPVNLEYGEIFAFYGRSLRHGNLPNETGLTRVSFDFRVVPDSLYRPAAEATINTRLKFAVGGYYERCAAPEVRTAPALASVLRDIPGYAPLVSGDAWERRQAA